MDAAAATCAFSALASSTTIDHMAQATEITLEARAAKSKKRAARWVMSRERAKEKNLAKERAKQAKLLQTM
jgi:hypothetical protein